MSVSIRSETGSEFPIVASMDILGMMFCQKETEGSHLPVSSVSDPTSQPIIIGDLLRKVTGSSALLVGQDAHSDGAHSSESRAWVIKLYRKHTPRNWLDFTRGNTAECFNA